jgi:hypothetical protein
MMHYKNVLIMNFETMQGKNEDRVWVDERQKRGETVRALE